MAGKFQSNAVQGDLFGGPVAQPRYVPKPQHVRNRLDCALAELRAATTMPWDRSWLHLNELTFRDIPRHLPDQDEAARYRAEFKRELERLLPTANFERVDIDAPPRRY